jgi:hypothetical protein
MDLVVYDDDEHRYVPWAVALTALAVVAVLAAVVAFLVGRQSSETQAVGGVSAPQAVTAPSQERSEAPSSAAGPSASSPAAVPAGTPACAEALAQADAALQRSVAIEQALAEQTRVMDELLAERVSTPQALDEVLPVLTDGATERKRFRELMVEYEQLRESCPD